jgi:MFS family permease
VTRVTRAGRLTFAALAVPNYRRYLSGQSISLIGTWMQMTAQSWLVLSLFGAAMALAALAPSLGFALVALALTGAASIAFMSTGNSTLQLGSDPSMRGRVMALWFVAFQGSTPIGGPVVGWVIAVAGARAGLALGAVTCLVVAAAGLVALSRRSSGVARSRGQLVEQTPWALRTTNFA